MASWPKAWQGSRRSSPMITYCCDNAAICTYRLHVRRPGAGAVLRRRCAGHVGGHHSRVHADHGQGGGGKRAERNIPHPFALRRCACDEKTGHTAFGAYVKDARTGSRDREALSAAQAEITKFNFDLELRAKQAFLAGDVAQAKEILGQCRPHFPPPRCGPGEWMISYDRFDLLFLGWEIDTGRFAAAWERVKTGKWIPRARGLVAVMMGPHAAAGDQEKIFELTRLAMRAGDRFDSCIMIVPPEHWARAPEAFGDAAEIRKLACDGHAKAALEKALSQQSVWRRTNALLIVAEGLMGIPGLSNERLQ
jgi:hypothetical protein